MKNLKNLIKINYNDLILFFLVFLNIINIIFYCKHNIFPSIITIILIILFFKLYNFKKGNTNKKKFLFTFLMMSIFGPVMESIIIHFSNGSSWNYKHPFLNWYIPLWLIPGYGILAMSSIHFYNNL